MDINPVVPKWQTPLKNWVYYYLPENRPKLKEIIVNFDKELNKIENVRSKQTSVNSFVAQTWLTHLDEPINFMSDKMSLESHIPISRNGFFFLQNYREKLDSLLTSIWAKFKDSDWKVEHKIKATNKTDEYFTKQFKRII